MLAQAALEYADLLRRTSIGSSAVAVEPQPSYTQQHDTHFALANANDVATGGGTEHKGPGTGVLITGCQSNETSADACPSGDPDKAFGALTNALTTTIDHVKKRNPKAAGNNKFIVTEVRIPLLL